MVKAHKVALLIETSRTSGRELLRGIAKYSQIHGPWVLFTEPSGLERILPNLKNWDVSGIIMRDSRRAEEIVALQVPTIVDIHFERSLQHIPRIVTNCKAIGKLAAEHFINYGFRRFGYCGYDKFSWSQLRGQAFCDMVAEAGYACHFYKQPHLRTSGAWNKEQGAIVDWLKSLTYPVGVLACNDDRSQNVLQACSLAGLRVPEDVAILGVDNDDMICDLSYPSLSSISLSFKKAGYDAAALLDRLMSGEKMSNQKIPVEPVQIVTRQSTNTLAVKDETVAEALNFIHSNCTRLIQTTDVADAVALSRSGLHNKFQRFLGRSVHDEIKRIRTMRIAKMLVDTNLSMSQIAVDLGCSDVDHLSRYCRKELGMSPLAYRKKYCC